MSTYFLLLLILTPKSIEVLSSVRHVVRCTRRFTAGYCDEDVKPVWTFVFQKQDCVMRMGCPPTLRVNRFHKYKHCFRRCKVLIDLYTQILLNDTAVQVDFSESQRRDIEGKSYLRTDISDAKDYEVLKDDARDIPSYDTEDNDMLEDVIPSNIDGDMEIHGFLDELSDNK